MLHIPNLLPTPVKVDYKDDYLDTTPGMRDKYSPIRHALRTLAKNPAPLCDINYIVATRYVREAIRQYLVEVGKERKSVTLEEVYTAVCARVESDARSRATVRVPHAVNRIAKALGVAVPSWPEVEKKRQAYQPPSPSSANQLSSDPPKSTNGLTVETKRKRKPLK